MPPTHEDYCAFCGKPRNDVGYLIAGATASICGECVQLCVDVLKNHMSEKEQAANEPANPDPTVVGK